MANILTKVSRNADCNKTIKQLTNGLTKSIECHWSNFSAFFYNLSNKYYKIYTMTKHFLITNYINHLQLGSMFLSSGGISAADCIT